MTCSLVCEALSAWADGEEGGARPLDVSRHLGGCAQCTAFAERLGVLSELTAALQAAGSPVADPPATTQPRTAQGRSARVRWLCWSVVVLGLVEIAAAGAELAADHGYGGEDHAGHESLSLVLAVSAGLLWVAWRPAYARSYLPVVGVAGVLLGASAAADVVTRRADAMDELPHLGFLIAFGILWLLSRDGGQHRRPGSLQRRPSTPAGSADGARLTVVRRWLDERRVVRPRGVSALLAGLVALVVVLLPSFASAHATLESSTPTADSVLTTAPTSVTLVFNEGITLLPDSVRVFAPNGGEVDDGEVVHTSGDAATAGVGLSSDLAQGTYLVSYRVVSADSHPIQGAYTFSIGHRTAAPTATSGASGSKSTELIFGLGRWVGFAGAALGLGGFAFLCWCFPAGWGSRGARRLVTVGIALLSVGTVVALLVKGPYDAGRGPLHLFDGGLLGEVLGSTYGRAVGVRILLIVLLVLLLRFRERTPDRVVSLAIGGLLVAVGVTFALCGHAAAGGHRLLAITSDTAHVVAMSTWLGGLVLLLATVLRAGAAPPDAVPVIQRFSRLATAGLVALIGTGIYQAVREAKTMNTLLFTHYGHVLLVKLAMVAVVLVAAAFSRDWVWESRRPLVVGYEATSEPSAPPAERGTPSLGRLRRSVAVESVILAGVLVASALLVTSNPTRAVATSAPVSTVLQVGPDKVRVQVDPTAQTGVVVRLQVVDAEGRPVEPKEVDASFLLVDKGVGPLPVVLSSGGTPGFRTGSVALPLTGRWQLAVTVRTSAIDEETASVNVQVS